MTATPEPLKPLCLRGCTVIINAMGFQNEIAAEIGQRTVRVEYSRVPWEFMTLWYPFPELAFGGIFDTLLPAFVLAFTFFTALVYAVLSRRFGEQRPAEAMSAPSSNRRALGAAFDPTDRQPDNLCVANLQLEQLRRERGHDWRM